MNDYYQKCRTKYLLTIQNAEIDNIPDWKIAEYCNAIEHNMILWDDLPSYKFYEFKNKNISKRDNGVDLITLRLDKVAQVKLRNNTYIRLEKMNNFVNMADDQLEIHVKLLLISSKSKLSQKGMIQNLIKKRKIEVVTYDYEKIKNKYIELSEQIKTLSSKEIKKIEIEKRHYLLDCYNIITNTSKNNIYLQLTCGSGKSLIMIYTIIELLKQNKDYKFAILVPWKDLMTQFYDLCKQFGLLVEKIGDGKHEIQNKNFNVVITMYQSLNHLLKKKINFHYVFCDEAHHIENKENKWIQDVHQLQTKKFIHFSATFYRQLDQIDYNYYLRQAIDDKYVSDYQLRVLYLKHHDRYRCILKYIKHNKDLLGCTFIYFNDIEQCKKFNKLLIKNNISSNYIYGKTPLKERNKIVNELNNNICQVVCLVGCWNESISIDCVTSVILGDLRHSDINKAQIILRASRIHHSKPYFNIILPLNHNDIHDNDHVQTFIKTLSKHDGSIMRDIINKNYMKIKVNQVTPNDDEKKDVIDGKEEDDYVSLEDITEEIYSSFGKMLNKYSQEYYLKKLNEIDVYLKKHNKRPEQKDKLTDGTFMLPFLGSCNQKYHKNIDKCKNYMKNYPMVKERYERLKQDYLFLLETYEESALRKLEELDVYFKKYNKRPPKKKKVTFTCGISMLTFLGNCNQNYHKCKQIMKNSQVVKKRYERLKHDYPLLFETKIESALRKLNELDVYFRNNNKRPNSEFTFTCDTNMSEFITYCNKNYHKDKKQCKQCMKNYPMVKERYERLKQDYLFLLETFEESALRKLEELDIYLKQCKKIKKISYIKAKFSDGTSMLTFLGNCNKNYHKDIKKCKESMKRGAIKERYERLKQDYLFLLENVEESALRKLEELDIYLKQCKKIPDRKVKFTDGKLMLRFIKRNNEKYHRDKEKCKQGMKIYPLFKKRYEQLISKYPKHFMIENGKVKMIRLKKS